MQTEHSPSWSKDHENVRSFCCKKIIAMLKDTHTVACKESKSCIHKIGAKLLSANKICYMQDRRKIVKLYSSSNAFVLIKPLSISLTQDCLAMLSDILIWFQQILG